MGSIGISNGVLNQKGSPAIYSDIYANRPNAGFNGRLFVSIDTGQIFEDTGTTWTLIADAGVGGGTLSSVCINGNTTATGITITANGLNTNSITQTNLTSGSVLFASTGGLISQDNTNLFWDNSLKRLGIGPTGTPTASLDIHSTDPVMIQINNTTTADSKIAFLNAGVGKWRIGNLYNSGANTFHIFNNTTTSNVLTITSANAATFIGSVTAQSLAITGGTSSQFLKADGTTDSTAYISLTSLSANSPLSYNSGTGAFTILQSSSVQNGYLSSTDWSTFNSKASLGSFSATSPLSYNSGTGAFSIQVANSGQSGYLSSTDWNTFNNKQSALSFGNLTETVSSVLTITGGTNAVIGSGTTIQMKQSSSTQSGYLSSTDWNTFNNKATQLNGTGFVKASGTTITYDNSTYYLASNPSNYITLTSLGASLPLVYNNLSGGFSINLADTSTNGYLSSTDWNTFNNKQGAITLTTTGTSGAATLVGNTLNIPQYSGGGGSMAIGGSITSATAGSVLYAGASGVLAQSNSNFYYDYTNNRLGLGTTSPEVMLQLGSNDNTNKVFSVRYSSVPLYINGGYDGTYALSTFSINNYNTSAGSSSWGGFSNTLYSSAAVQLASSTIGAEIRFLTSATPNTNPTTKLTIASTGAATFTSSVTSTSFIKTSGTSAQILAADGSVITAGTNITISGGTISSSGGSITLSAIGSIPNANGATITGSVLNLQPASSSFGGVVTTGTQTLAGEKTITSATSQTLTLKGRNTGATNNTQLRFYGSASAADLWAIGSEIATDTTSSAFDFYSIAGAANRLRIDSSGNVGINTITIGSKLQVNGNAAIGYSASTAAPTNGLAVAGGVTIGTTTANVSSIVTTGYSLTGANAQSLLDLAGTWNTTGNPTAIKLNITNTASGSTSNLMDLQVGGSSLFKVDKSGNLTANNVLSGTYTPTLTAITNISALTAFTCQYMRVGNVVTVSGKVYGSPTAISTETQFRMTVPINSAMTAVEQAGGTGRSSNGSSGDGFVAFVNAYGTNEVRFSYWAPAILATGGNFWFSFTYLIV